MTPFPTENLYIGKLHPATAASGEPQWEYTEEGVWERVHLFHDVAYTGDYDDLSNKPILPQTIAATQGEFLNAYDAATGLFSTATIDLSEYATETWVTNNFLQSQVQSDWNVTDTNSAAYILNKPTIESSLWSEGSSQIHRDGHVTIGTNADSAYKEGLTVVGFPEPGQSYPNYPFAVIKHGTDISESFGFVNNILFSIFRASSESWGLLAKFMPSETEWDGTSVEFDRVLVQDNSGRIVYANRSEFGEGEGGVTNFTGLTDTPSNYTGSGGKIVAVNSEESGLEFVDSSGGDMVYPSSGIAVSTGSAWAASITDNSSNWNTAYSWGNHAAVGYLTSAVQTLNNRAGAITLASGDNVEIVESPDGTFTFNASGTGGDMVYPGAGIPVSTGTSWSNSIANNSDNWNAAYGWGDHSQAGYLTALPTHDIITAHSGFTSGGTRFLKEDGTWATPEGGGGLPAGTEGDVAVYNDGEWKPCSLVKINFDTGTIETQGDVIANV